MTREIKQKKVNSWTKAKQHFSCLIPLFFQIILYCTHHFLVLHHFIVVTQDSISFYSFIKSVRWVFKWKVFCLCAHSSANYFFENNNQRKNWSLATVVHIQMFVCSLGYYYFIYIVSLPAFGLLCHPSSADNLPQLANGIGFIFYKAVAFFICSSYYYYCLISASLFTLLLSSVSFPFEV